MNREIPARAIFSPSYRNYNMKNIRNEKKGKLREQEEGKEKETVSSSLRRLWMNEKIKLL